MAKKKFSELSDKQVSKIQVKLAWELLEDKLKYYHGSDYGLKPISDAAYDKKEFLYIRCCKRLGIEPTATDTVGFPFDSPSGRLIVSKFQL